MRRLLPLTIMLIVAVSSFARPATEQRQRFQVTLGSYAFTVTRIDTIGETVTTHTAIVRDDSNGKMYRLQSIRNFAAQTGEYRMADLSTNAWVSAKYDIPMDGRTLQAAAAESRRQAKAGKTLKLRLSTAGASQELDEMQWRMPNASAASRNLVKGTLSAEFLRTAERLHSIASVPQLEEFCMELLTPLLGQSCRPTGALRLATLPPDCSFDAKGGHPCSAVQVQNAAAVRAKGRGHYY